MCAFHAKTGTRRVSTMQWKRYPPLILSDSGYGSGERFYSRTMTCQRGLSPHWPTHNQYRKMKTILLQCVSEFSESEYKSEHDTECALMCRASVLAVAPDAPAKRDLLFAVSSRPMKKKGEVCVKLKGDNAYFRKRGRVVKIASTQMRNDFIRRYLGKRDGATITFYARFLSAV